MRFRQHEQFSEGLVGPLPRVLDTQESRGQTRWSSSRELDASETLNSSLKGQQMPQVGSRSKAISIVFDRSDVNNGLGHTLLDLLRRKLTYDSLQHGLFQLEINETLCRSKRRQLRGGFFGLEELGAQGELYCQPNIS